MEQFNAEKMIALLNSPEGKQLISYMQKDGGTALNKAILAVKSGNYDQAQKVLTPLFEGTDAKSLAQKLGVLLG